MVAFRTLCAVVTLGICLGSFAQTFPVDTITGRISYTGVVQVDSASADELFSRATLWYAATFSSAEAAMGLSDRATGVITSDPAANFTATYYTKGGKKSEMGYITFSLKILCRDGRYKYTLTDLTHKGGDTGCSMGALEDAKSNNMCLWQSIWSSIRVEADKNCVALVQGLTDAMNSRAALDGGDW